MYVSLEIKMNLFKFTTMAFWVYKVLLSSRDGMFAFGNLVDLWV